MRRPDQDKLEMYARDYETIDHKLEIFSKDKNLGLEVNALRQPCRVLRRRGNPEILIDISLSDWWREIPFDANIRHSINLVAYYEPADGPFMWKYTNGLLDRVPFSVLREKLDSCLENALNEINRLTPELIMEKGERIENLKKKYNG